MSDTSKHYASIGRQVRDTLKSRHGDAWKKLLSAEVQEALVAREAFFITLGAAREGMTAEQLEEHGRQTYNAAMKACGLDPEM